MDDLIKKHLQNILTNIVFRSVEQPKTIRNIQA